MEINIYSEAKPWGRFERFLKNQPCTVKLLYINPFEEISLQYHNKRDEFLKIIRGEATIVAAYKTVEAKEGEAFYIFKKIVHRIKAKGMPVVVLEISFGEYDEEDVVRLEDKYNRI